MDRHILLTVSDEASALQAVRFAADCFIHTDKLHLTLLYVAPNPKAGLSESEIIQDYSALTRREKQSRQNAQAALDRAADILLSRQFPENNIHKKIAFKQFGTAQDIIQEGQRGLYDAIALGRRGLSRLEELLADSISKQLFTTPMEIPLWVCRQQVTVPRNVLLCTDGSPASLRCADHVGFMLRDEPQHAIAVTHVTAPGTDIDPRQILLETRRMLENNGIPADRIDERVLEGRSATESIVRMASTEHFGIVASGRTGRGESRTLHLLGSVSMSLLKRLETTLWISH